MVLVACAQMCSTDSVADNFAMSVKLARDTAAAGAKALFLPEASDYIANDAHLGNLLAGGCRLHLVDIQLKDPGAQTIPCVKLPRTGEHQKIIPGSIITTPVDMDDIGRVGLEICYDIGFPELHITLRRKGADVITIPSAFTVPMGRAHWHTLLRAVAINYRVYVIAAAGAHSPARSSWGEALVFDPWGTELGRLPSIDAAAYPTCPMPPQFIFADKREDIYGMVGANTFVCASTAQEQQQPGVLERVWRGVKNLLGYGSVCLQVSPSTESIVAAKDGRRY
ncbi:carbon-nitrogen hydrolase [Mycena latifolia]|nr:carbon-nitrogen hydrolase [Mycena latifolia]